MSSPSTGGARRSPDGGSAGGPSRLVRGVAIAVALLLAVVLLFTIVFPWFDENFVNDPVLGWTAHTAAEADAD